jgi:hypothetical protein
MCNRTAVKRLVKMDFQEKYGRIGPVSILQKHFGAEWVGATATPAKMFALSLALVG